MPAKISVLSVIGTRSSGKRGRKAAYNVSDYLLEVGGFLDCLADVSTDSKCDADIVCEYLADGTVADESVTAIVKAAKKYRQRVKDSNKCESLTEISPLTLVAYLDDEGNEQTTAGYFRLDSEGNLPEATDDESDEASDDEATDDDA